MKEKLYPFIFVFLIFYSYCSNKPTPVKETIEEELFTKLFPNEEKYDKHLIEMSKKYNINWLFAKAVLIKESHYKEDSVSVSGAVGLMQLMPREGSYTNTNYNNYMKSRKQRRNNEGIRYYKGKSASEWGKLYQHDLKNLVVQFQSNPQELFSKDKRFDPMWNIKSGVQQLAREYHYFKKRGHSDYKAMILAAAAYNAGRGAVRLSKDNKRYDRIPINQQTELYIGGVIRIFNALERGDGRIFKWEEWVIWI